MRHSNVSLLSVEGRVPPRPRVDGVEAVLRAPVGAHHREVKVLSGHTSSGPYLNVTASQRCGVESNGTRTGSPQTSKTIRPDDTTSLRGNDEVQRSEDAMVTELRGIVLKPTFLTFFERFFAELLVRTCCLTR